MQKDKKHNIESADVFEKTTYTSYLCSSYRGLTVVQKQVFIYPLDFAFRYVYHHRYKPAQTGTHTDGQRAGDRAAYPLPARLQHSDAGPVRVLPFGDHRLRHPPRPAAGVGVGLPGG